MTPKIEAQLRSAGADSLVLEFDPKRDFEKLITPTAQVVVAGGDGTIGFVVRKLADSKHPVGIISMGTFNNFAAALKLPKSLDRAIEVAKEGKARPITLGRVNGKVFLEAAAIRPVRTPTVRTLVTVSLRRTRSESDLGPPTGDQALQRIDQDAADRPQVRG
jgi:predicted polyphosphate/ATP-dependent NAD kinase